ncbi:MAG: glycosyltransferase family 1 protein, partial [Halioglobus sp.]|nr:glycosyltransferase family 1 protein [Halioglobus sp.]
MKIAIDARTIATSTGRYIERLLTYLQQADEDNEYLVLVRSQDKQYWQPAGENFRIVEADFADFSLAEQLGLLRLLRRLQPDLVHFCMPQFPVLYRGRFVSTVHDLTVFHPLAGPGNTVRSQLSFRLRRLVFGHVLRRAVTGAQRVITPSEFTRGALLERIDGALHENIHVTYEAADPISVEPAPMAELADARFALYVGRAWPSKNLRTLIDAYGSVKKKHPDLKLVLAGRREACHDDLQAYARQQGIADIRFPGFVSEGQLRWLYENAAVYVFPSFSEGFGLPGLEAMQHGAPVLASNSVQSGRAGAGFCPGLPALAGRLVWCRRCQADRRSRCPHR